MSPFSYVAFSFSFPGLTRTRRISPPSRLSAWHCCKRGGCRLFTEWYLTLLCTNRYARFLQAFTADVALAMSALESAKAEMPSLEGEFETFSRLRTLQQKQQVSVKPMVWQAPAVPIWYSHRCRGVLFVCSFFYFQSQVLGAERDMNMIALVEYNKRLTTALEAHEQCLRAQLAAYDIMRRGKNALESVPPRLEPHLDVWQANSHKARKMYLRLLRTNPQASHLGTVFSQFCRDVIHDNTLAEQYGNPSGQGTYSGRSAGQSSYGRGSLGRSSSGGSQSQLSTTNRTTSSWGTTLTLRKYVVARLLRFVLLCCCVQARRCKPGRYGRGVCVALLLCWSRDSWQRWSYRSYVPISNWKDVEGIQRSLRCGTLALIFFAVVILLMTRFLIDLTFQDVGALDVAGIQRKFTVDCAYVGPPLCFRCIFMCLIGAVRCVCRRPPQLAGKVVCVVWKQRQSCHS